MVPLEAEMTPPQEKSGQAGANLYLPFKLHESQSDKRVPRAQLMSKHNHSISLLMEKTCTLPFMVARFVPRLTTKSKKSLVYSGSYIYLLHLLLCRLHWTQFWWRCCRCQMSRSSHLKLNRTFKNIKSCVEFNWNPLLHLLSLTARSRISCAGLANLRFPRSGVPIVHIQVVATTADLQLKANHWSVF